MIGQSFRVHVIDDDLQVLRAFSRALVGAGYEVRMFAEAESFMNEHDPEAPGCAIVDLGLPGKDGLELQQELESCGRPVIFVTGQGTVSASVKAMKAGALDFLEKPVDMEILLAAIGRARRVDEATREMVRGRRNFEECITRLTRRERQVLDQVVVGRLNKQIAADLGTVEKTIKVHRSRMMEKMGVKTVAELVRMVGLYQS